MKVAVTSTGPTLDDNVEARFGRCAYFLIIDTDTMQYEAVENPNVVLGGGAGIQSARLMSEKGVTAVLTGNCGPNAFAVFGQAGIQVVVGVSGTVRNAVEQFKAGAFSFASGPNVAGHFGMNAAPASQTPAGQLMTGPFAQAGGMGFGMGSGRGMGRWGRMGRGMGRGRGMERSMGMSGPMSMPSTGSAAGQHENAESQNTDQELAALKQQAKILEQQKQQLHQRITQLESGYRTVAVVDLEKCVGCSICEDVCPVEAIKVDEYAKVNSDMCKGCGACVAQCPQHAIALKQQKTSE